MNDFNSYEYRTEQKAEGRWLLFRILLIFSYIIYTAAYFTIIVITRFVPLGALIPLTLWMLVFFTWRYANPDYEYTIAAGIFIFTVIYGNRTKKKKAAVKLCDAEAIAPLTLLSSDIAAIPSIKVYNALPSKRCEDAYALLYKKQNGSYAVIYFMATAQALKLIHFYNHKTKIQRTKY